MTELKWPPKLDCQNEEPPMRLTPDDEELYAAGMAFWRHVLGWLGVLAIVVMLGLAWLLPHLGRG